MADKKEHHSLEGKKVEIFLQTPLFRFKYKVDHKEQELLENAVHISGTVREEKGAGILLKVSIISNLKQKQTDLPFEEILIPYSKIDFVIVE